MKPGKEIELRDEGQDFTKLFLDGDGVITGAAPFQGWLWKGYQVLQKRIRAGMFLRIRKPGQKPLRLRYPVIAVATIREPARAQKKAA